MRRRRGSAIWWGAALATALAAVPAAAHADASARLVYVRGPGAAQCPGEQAVRAAVGARLGYDPFFASARDTVIAEIRRHNGAFRTVVRLIDADKVQKGARAISVQGGDCSAVVDAIGLVISLTIDPAAVLGPARRSPANVPEPPPSPAPEPAADEIEERAVIVRPLPPPPEPPRRPWGAWSLYAGVGAMGSVSAAPAPTPGAKLFVGAAWRRLSVDLEARADYPASGTGDVGPAPVRSWLLVGAVVPCLHAGAAFGCTVLGAGVLGATAPNAVRPSTQYGPWTAVGARVGAAREVVPRLELRAYAEALATLTRDTLWVDSTRVYRVRPWSGGLAVAVAWRFR